MAEDGVIIVGGGIAGAALATVLAQDGHRVMVIERSMKPPNRLQGELIPQGGIDALLQLGLEDCLKDIDSTTCDGFIIHEENQKDITIKFEPGIIGLSFRNGNLVNNLRKRAQKESNCTFIEASATDLVEENGVIKGVVYQRTGENEKQTLRGALTVICQGTFSSLRKVNVPGKMTKKGVVIGIEYPLRTPEETLLHPSQSGESGETYYVRMILTKDTTSYVNHLGNGLMRYGTVIRVEHMPQDHKEFIKRQLKTTPGIISDPAMSIIEDATVVQANTYELPGVVTFKHGVITIGDSLNIRHPLTAAGMTVAFKDVKLWRDLLRTIPNLQDEKVMRQAHQSFINKRRSYGLSFNAFANLFHDLLYVMNDEGIYYRRLGHEYMEWSPSGKKTLSRMLNLVETRPSELYYQMFMMTMYSAVRTVFDEPWWKLPIGLLKGIKYLFNSTKHIISVTRAESATYT